MQKKEKISEVEGITIETKKTETRTEKNGQSLSDQLENIKWSNIHVSGIS